MDYGKSCPHGLPPGGCLNCRAQSEASQAAYNQYAPGKPLKMPAAPKLSTEQVIAELWAWLEKVRKERNPAIYVDKAMALIAELPKPDVVEECAKAYKDGFDAVYGSSSEWSDHLEPERAGGVKAALKRYRELGCPEIPE